jgi:hypothetical protein
MGFLILGVILVYLMLYGGLLVAGLFAQWFGDGAAIWGVLVPLLAGVVLVLRWMR